MEHRLDLPSFSEQKLSQRRVLKLSKLAGIPAEQVADKPIAEIRAGLSDVVSPLLLFGQRICGQVVKTDAATGESAPVPFATVHIEDTDCGFFAYSPPGVPWSWLYPVPFWCHREELATVETDACGRFCAWIPRFEIDWIQRWIRLFLCYPLRPRIIDLIPRLPEPILWPPGPAPLPEGVDPDRVPGLLAIRPQLPDLLEKQLGRETAEQIISKLDAVAEAGIGTPRLRQALEAPAFDTPPPAPINAEILDRLRSELSGLVAVEQAGKPILGLRRAKPWAPTEVESAASVDPRRFLGPFMRCRGLHVPILRPVFDVPDISFRVTQDVDDDGDQETIYAEGLFDVRWDMDPIPDVTLNAWEIAVAGSACDVPPLECATRGIERVDFYPLKDADYHDNASGYAVRPNRPQPQSGAEEAAETPFSGTLHLFGCNDYPGASFYRLRYRMKPYGSADWTGQVSFNHRWLLHRSASAFPSPHKKVVEPDASGWYRIIDTSEGWYPDHMLLRWPAAAPGLYEVELEFANGDSEPGEPMDVEGMTPVRLYIDNSNVTLDFDRVEWRHLPFGHWQTLGGICPVVRRTEGLDVEVRVKYSASAYHFRSVNLWASGCGDGNLVYQSGSESHWHSDVSENHWSDTVVYHLAHDAAEGSYHFDLRGVTRAFSPADHDEGAAIGVDWLYDPIRIYRHRQFIFSVINDN
jgi:hypothetical protein